ncbi:MAG: histidinol-phosphatase HisJ family protein [Coriobacteriia bacterium]|nr:histidinol-phosphatase HisJ family protein [Coriobacteriia bacterium]
MMIDLHIHTARCGHAAGRPSEYVAAARQAGLEVIAFTDHLALPDGYDPDGEYAMRPGELAEYVADVRKSAATGGPPRVLLGIEADWVPPYRAQTARAIAAYPFDVVLGSVHFLGDWAFDDPRLIDEWSLRDVAGAWDEYFEVFTQAASSGLFDVMAHPDLVKKFGHVPPGDLISLYDDVAAAMADAGVAVEVSSAGLRKPCREIYPSDDLLAAFRRAGVPVTTASDAHTPEEVGSGLGEVRAAVARAGYESIVYFEAREMREVPL